MQKTLPTRDQVDARFTWRLQDLYATEQEWEEDFHAIERMLKQVAVYRGKLGESANTLLRWLHFADDLNIISGKLGNYAFRRYDEDTANNRYQGMMDRVLTQHARMSTETAWVIPELLAIPESRIGEFLAEETDLLPYAHHLDEIMRMKPHTLDSEQEQLLALSSDAMNAVGTIFSMFNDADIRFGSIIGEDGTEVEVTKGRYIQFQESSQRRVREDAYHALYSAYGSWKNTLTATLSGQIKREMFYAKARRHETTREMSLFGDNIPTAVYDNVVETVNAHLDPLQRSISMRREILGLDAVRPWDLYVPLVPEANVRYTFDEAVSLIRDALGVLGPEYSRDLEEAFSGCWIDIYENQGKASGAYSAWTYGQHPFILMNYSDTLKDVFTLAHELGHAMHSYYTWKNQPPVYGGYTIFCAEVASTCNEMLLVDHMLKTQKNSDVQKQLLFHFIDTIRGTVYNQALFAEFEHFVHGSAEAGTPLTVDLLNGKMAALYERYYGTDFRMDDAYALNWARIPHFYRSFDVFQYATGLSAAVALSQRILGGTADALSRYHQFLRSGNSRYSIDLLREAGVDMTTVEPIAATAALMNDLLDRVEQLL